MNTFDTNMIDNEISYRQATLLGTSGKRRPVAPVHKLRQAAGILMIRTGEAIRGTTQTPARTTDSTRLAMP